MIASVTAGTERSTIQAPHPETFGSPRANSLWNRHFAVWLCLVGMVGSGCIFSPDKGKGKDPPKDPITYPARNTPAGSILYLTIAWSNRDSVRIDSVYASDYEGSSVDLTDNAGSTTLVFRKSDEVHTVGALARSSEINYTNMNFNLASTWTEVQYSSDPPEWVTVQIPQFKIEVRDIHDVGYAATSPADGETWIFEFTLRPTYPNGPSALPVWEIVRWVESRAKL